MIVDSFRNIFAIPDLRKRVLFMFALLGVYRIGCNIPTPGIDPQALLEFMASMKDTFLGFVNTFTGGSLERVAVFALGIMPYITASIVLQLLTVVWPFLEKLSKEGELGRRKITQYTRYLTMGISTIQSITIALWLERMTTPGGASLVVTPGWGFRLMTVLTLTTGCAFVMWLGEQISERGVGNGISLIIFSGIVANLPLALGQVFELTRTGQMSVLFLLFLLVMAVAVIAVIVFVERAQRRIVVRYPKRQVGSKMFGGEASHLPMKINPSGVIPPIFASSLLLMPLTVAGFSASGGPEWLTWVTATLGRGQPLFLVVFVALIVFFAFFYTGIVFNPYDTADSLKKNGGFIPGIRPGKNTGDYLNFVLMRLTAVGALYLSLVCIMPEILITKFAVPFYFGGTSLLIVVSVTMDTVGQVHSHLLAHQYEGLIKKAKLKGRRG